ncbi:G-protein coupled receptor 1 [Bufo bufo]|uniref:G-protein coupled receptor 1 n=1 Tax=Bufo bufo TaxID=8384 RepID=UPI001ABE3A70|nr:G-protein coupled receptor 1 [Bufo bufo]XP_040297176.1 G-protein coupled receptor 1 [Bufo bufo]XP_040297177.1 G-protein coupled receptor 1 [Bufo bufo]XP_040297178.1 G-protein coupled receptor 1 [Bufo bufo]XP_040297179.1 G-protein coupled receptor 1 [Bufo bufo]XP_040297180.1 G-protein coupled receptor 1 [Bufo bufo]XP_040297181.1 G-protein coupled receptor 1 [Bufo bufo]
MNSTINDSAIDDLYNYMYDYDDFEEGPHNEVQMHALHVASLVIYSLAFLLGVPGNVMVIWFTGFKWKKTVSTIWFLNLAVADLIFVLFLPLHITYVATNFHWPFGKLLCKLNSFIAILNMFASVFFLTVICLDKYISLVWPSIQRHRTVKISGVVSGFVWSIATFIASPSLYFRDTEMKRSTIVCFNHFHETDYFIVHKIHTSLTLVKFFVGYLFPLLTMVTCYTILSIRMKRRATQTNSKFFWMVLAIVVAFFLCWTPYHIFSLLELHIHHSDAYSEWLRIGIPISTSLAFVNSCVNPILYVLISKAFRTHLEASLAEIFKNTIRDISQTGIKSDDMVLSENNFTLLETMT